MANQSRPHRLSVNIRRGTKWGLTMGLAASLLSGSGAQISGATTIVYSTVQSAVFRVKRGIRTDFRSQKRMMEKNANVRHDRMKSTEPREVMVQDERRIAAEKALAEADRLHRQGTTESLRKAVEKYAEAIALFRAVGDRSGEATVLINLGATYEDLGEKRTALEHYNRALLIAQAWDNQEIKAKMLFITAGAYVSLGEHQNALNYYNLALTSWHALGDQEAEADALAAMSIVYRSLGQHQKALECYNRALPLYRAVGGRRMEARTLDHIGEVYRLEGEQQKALEYHNQALMLGQATGDRGEKAGTLGKIGEVYSSLGEKQMALDYYNRALSIARAESNHLVDSYVLNAIGSIYADLGEYQKALDYYDQALSIVQAINDRSGEPTTLTNIGRIYHSLGKYQKALDYYNQVLELCKAKGDHGCQATALSNIGSVYASLGEKQTALEFFNRLLSFHRATANRSGEAATLTYLGSVYADLGEHQKALGHYGQALLLSRFLGNRETEAIILSNIALTERDIGDLEGARAKIEASLKIIESLRIKVARQDLRTSYFASVQDNYEFYIDLLMRLHKQRPTDRYDAAAIQASERARARLLLESLTESRANIRQGVDQALLSRERTLQQQLNAKAEFELKLLASPHTESQAAAVKKEIETLITELQQVQAQIRQASPGYAALTQPQPLTLTEIQREFDADTILLEYALGNKRSYLWAVTPTSISSYELPKRAEVEAAARQFYDLLTAGNRGARGETAVQRTLRLNESNKQYRGAATKLSQMLLGPVAEQLGTKRLVIVADGALQYVPFGALPIPVVNDEGGLGSLTGRWKIMLPTPKPASTLKSAEKEADLTLTPLILKHEIVNLPSASTLAVLRREVAGRKPAAKTLAVLADPVFTKDDERIKPGARRTEQRTSQLAPNPVNERILKQLTQNPTGEPGELRIARLPFTRQEAERILALVPAGVGMKALDFESSRATAMSDQLSQYRYVHFATHGLADSERPELSTIVLSLFDEQGRPQEGFLRAHEIYNLNLPAELVVLSACETGLGKQIKGEGLVSLTRGFMYAGAARVVVSLWSVSDRATAELMEKFYRKMLVEKQRPAAALRAAQIEMWKQPQWRAPYYWAAFTLQGEWR